MICVNIPSPRRRHIGGPGQKSEPAPQYGTDIHYLFRRARTSPPIPNNASVAGSGTIESIAKKTGVFLPQLPTSLELRVNSKVLTGPNELKSTYCHASTI